MGVVMRTVLVLLFAGMQGCYQADFSADGGAVVCSNDEGCGEGRRCLRGVCLKSSTVGDVGVSPSIREAGPAVNDVGSSPLDAGAPVNDLGSPVNDAGAVAVCGNQVVEGGEVCDDGNTESGDGCTANCALEVNDVSLWRVPSGGVEEQAATSCQAILNADCYYGSDNPYRGHEGGLRDYCFEGSWGDSFFIDPDGAGSGGAHQVLCEELYILFLHLFFQVYLIILG